MALLKHLLIYVGMGVTLLAGVFTLAVFMWLIELAFL